MSGRAQVLVDAGLHAPGMLASIHCRAEHKTKKSSRCFLPPSGGGRVGPADMSQRRGEWRRSEGAAACHPHHYRRNRKPGAEDVHLFFFL